MFRMNRIVMWSTACFMISAMQHCRAQSVAAGSSAIRISVMDRTRIDSWKWFNAPAYSNTYGYVESLLRIGMSQRIRNWDWELELAQPSVLGLPDDAVSFVATQGQLGLGGTYYAANGNNTEPAAAFFKQGFLRYDGEDKFLRIGRFEFIDGQETSPRNIAIAWLQSNRIAHRLIGNFGFSNAQRSFDGLDAHASFGAWNVTAFAARADQGVFNMNGNPELNVDLQYLALTRAAQKQHILWRAFAIAYHDGRTGLAKTDNRALALRKADFRNTRIGAYGGDLLAVAPAGPGQFDFLFWGALQNGSWGSLDHSANAAAVEGGFQLTKLRSSPWMRGGWFRSSGDNNTVDGTHGTFFQVLPTPRIYAQVPFYNLMNSTDEFVQLIDKPAKRLALRSDLHWLQLTSADDLWYQGGGAFDNKVFGYVGRPANGSSSLASVADVSAGWQTTKNIALNFYYAYTDGKTVVAAIYPSDRNLQYGYMEFIYTWGHSWKGGGSQ